MKKIHCLNPIAACGTDLFPADYEITDNKAEADAFLVRSASMHEMELPEGLLAVGRAGAGVNNIPLDECAKAGVVVFNTPGANANGVKELVLAGMFLASRDIVGGIKWCQDNAQDENIAKTTEKSKKAFVICKEKIAKHKLDMKLIEAEYTFDNNKVLFYFTADGRIDFRELVKDLASVFKTRIELRQIGVRDETKMVGGIGICGRELCCHKHLSEFVPVSIKMAKEQNLSLNPTKISGVCGRLMCCLKHEQDTYEYLNEKLPNVGDFVRTTDGNKGEVLSVSVLRQKVRIVVTDKDDNKEVMEYPVSELKFKPKKRRSTERISDEEYKALEALEDKGGKSKFDD